MTCDWPKPRLTRDAPGGGSLSPPVRPDVTNHRIFSLSQDPALDNIHTSSGILLSTLDPLGLSALHDSSLNVCTQSSLNYWSEVDGFFDNYFFILLLYTWYHTTYYILLHTTMLSITPEHAPGWTVPRTAAERTQPGWVVILPIPPHGQIHRHYFLWEQLLLLPALVWNVYLSQVDQVLVQ